MYALAALAMAGGASAALSTGMKFTGLPNQMVYKDVQALGTCQKAPLTRNGVGTPLDEEYHFIVRGPTQIEQFAVYTKGSTATKRSAPLPRKSIKERRHAHAKLHEAHKKRAYGDVIVATYPGGGLMTFTDTWDTPQTELNLAPPAATPAAAAPASPAPAASPAEASPAAGGNAPQAAPVINGAGFNRAAYYDSQSATAQGVNFLGAFYSDPFYVQANGDSHTGSAGSPQVLANTLIPDNREIIITSDQAGSRSEATNSGVINKGWAGDKIAFFKFAMPQTGSTEAPLGDAPAIWALNSKIVNAQQYGCNCGNYFEAGTGGCGEFDIFEVIDNTPANIGRGTASLHMGDAYAATHPDYIARPTGDSIIIAASMVDGVAQVRQLPSNFQLPETLDDDVVSSILNGGSVSSGLPGASFLAINKALSQPLNACPVTLNPFSDPRSA